MCVEVHSCISDMKYLITKCFTKPCILLAPRRWSSFEFESESCRVVIKNTNHLLPSSAPAPAECTAEFPPFFFKGKIKTETSRKINVNTMDPDRLWGEMRICFQGNCSAMSNVCLFFFYCEEAHYCASLTTWDLLLPLFTELSENFLSAWQDVFKKKIIVES